MELGLEVWIGFEEAKWKRLGERETYEGRWFGGKMNKLNLLKQGLYWKARRNPVVDKVNNVLTVAKVIT